MHHVMVMGAGKIGSMIACLLADSGAYEVYLADRDVAGQDVTRLRQAIPTIQFLSIDVADRAAMTACIKDNAISAVISSLPYFLNRHVAEIAKATDVHYFDLTEDVLTATEVKVLSNQASKAFVPQCGLAPGFINIIANDLMQAYDICHHAKLRVGALPEATSNGLNYSLTWSTDGLINEYGNSCYGIELGELVVMPPLQGLERIQLDGREYEAFNTSGGIGSLGDSYLGRIQTLNYKTIRYPGHCEKMHFLMKDLQLNDDRDTLKRILERAIPKTQQDMVLIYVSVEGIQAGALVETNYVKRIYPQSICGLKWTAIQVCTAASVCAVMDNVLERSGQYKGLVTQEQFSLSDIVNNRFGHYYA